MVRGIRILVMVMMVGVGIWVCVVSHRVNEEAEIGLGVTDPQEAKFRLLKITPEVVRQRDEMGRTELMWAAFGGYSAAVLKLIEGGADVNALADDGSTPLLMAACMGRAEAVRILLDHGAAVSVPGQQRPALHAAVMGGNVEVARLLVEHGACTTARDRTGETVIEFAKERGASREMMEVLGD